MPATCQSPPGGHTHRIRLPAGGVLARHRTQSARAGDPLNPPHHRPNSLSLTRPVTPFTVAGFWLRPALPTHPKRSPTRAGDPVTTPVCSPPACRRWDGVRHPAGRAPQGPRYRVSSCHEPSASIACSHRHWAPHAIQVRHVSAAMSTRLRSERLGLSPSLLTARQTDDAAGGRLAHSLGRVEVVPGRPSPNGGRRGQRTLARRDHRVGHDA